MEFERIKESLIPLTKTELGKELVVGLGSFLPYPSLLEEKDLLQEMIYLRERFGALPIESSPNLDSSLLFARKGGVLNASIFESIAHDILTNASVHRYFAQVEEAHPLKDLALKTADLSFLEQEIHRVIGPDLEILDQASPTLKSIRSSIRKLTKEINKRLNGLIEAHQEYLTSSSLTMRDGHYVLPVSTSYKTKVKGIIMDISHSGGTTFIEPEILVSLNNKMKELQIDEKEEIQQILAELSRNVVRFEEEIRAINQMIGRLDFLEAKAKYSDIIKGIIAPLEDRPLILLKDARHPLIDPDKVVPNDFSIRPETPIYVISGPNAGGKTIALKTVGLLVFMNECGLPIPAKDGSRLGYFNHIYVDIGDSQSIADSLSTFSGHMKNLSSLLSSVGGKDLVLLDEVGTGTSPREGECLAYAVLMYLKKKHAFSLVSSHFEGLKAAALSEEGIMNASMRFDEETLEPTYRLIEGIPGDSYGLIVAKRFGMNDEVMRMAEEKANETTDISVSETLRKLNDTASVLEKERNALAKEKEDFLKQKAQLDEKEAKLERRMISLQREIASKKEEELEAFRKKADEILENLNKDTVKKGDVTKAKNALDDLLGKEEEVRFDEELKPGDYVLLPSLGLEGRIRLIQGNSVTLVTQEGLTFQTKKDRLTKIREPKEKAEPLSGIKLDSLGIGKSVPLELNLIGMRAEPALAELDKYIDSCRLKHYKRVRIIHGFGGGVLRKVVQEYCKKHADFIDHIEGAGESEGAGGATIVYLK